MGRSKTAEFANPSLLGEGTNWQTAIFRPASMQNYNLNMSGGVKGTSYKVGAGYLRQDGIAEGSDFDRITLSAAIDSEVNKWLKSEDLLICRVLPRLPLLPTGILSTVQ